MCKAGDPMPYPVTTGRAVRNPIPSVSRRGTCAVPHREPLPAAKLPQACTPGAEVCGACTGRGHAGLLAAPAAQPVWRLERGAGPLVAVALHAGHELRPDLQDRTALAPDVRRREEDPFTDEWTPVAPVRVGGTHSRFQVDLNRPRERAVYRTPEDCWGLTPWHAPLPDRVVAASLAEYDAFYRMLARVFRRLVATYGHFVVLDLHSYNHRRAGPCALPEDPQGCPQINVGTGSLRNRARWGRLVERFQRDLAGCEVMGTALDVRENVRFRGGQLARWTHSRFANSACVLAVEVKKFFMDEWTGEPDRAAVEAIGDALASTVPGILAELEKL